jgi:hypothetical protein
MANFPRTGYARGTSGLAPAPDIPSEMSDSPLTPDLPTGALVRLGLTRLGHCALTGYRRIGACC